MEPLNANDAQRYAEFKEWTPFEAALLLAGCKPLPRGQIPEPKAILLPLISFKRFKFVAYPRI